MAVKNVASSVTNVQRNRFGGLSALATSDDVKNFSCFGLSDFIHANLSNNINHVIVMT